MTEEARVNRADRSQLRWDMVDLDSQLGEDHRARSVWEFVSGLDLSAFYDRIKSRGERAGRPATDPSILLAVWLYATLEGVGSARALDRLGGDHAAHRWLGGGGGGRHHIPSAFPGEGGGRLGQVVTARVAGPSCGERALPRC